MWVTILSYATFVLQLILKGVGWKSPGRLWGRSGSSAHNFHLTRQLVWPAQIFPPTLIRLIVVLITPYVSPILLSVFY
jgi:hypothetical protein